MNKYNIVSLLNFLIGIPLVTYIIFRIPSIPNYLKADPVVQTKDLTGLGAMFIVGVINLFIGFKLISQLGNKDKYFTVGTLSFLASFVLFGSALALLIFSIIFQLLLVLHLLPVGASIGF